VSAKLCIQVSKLPLVLFKSKQILYSFGTLILQSAWSPKTILDDPVGPPDGRDKELPDGPELGKLKGTGVVGVEDGMGLVGDPVGFRDVVSSVETVGLDEGYADGSNVGFIDGSPEGFFVGAFDGAGGFGCAH
jgi:hypothetical protein